MMLGYGRSPCLRFTHQRGKGDWRDVAKDLFGSEVNLFGHVVEAYLIMPKNVVSSQNVSGSSSAEKSYSARELTRVTLQANAHL